jgi:hypothetical protein
MLPVSKVSSAAAAGGGVVVAEAAIGMANSCRPTRRSPLMMASPISLRRPPRSLAKASRTKSPL